MTREIVWVTKKKDGSIFGEGRGLEEGFLSFCVAVEQLESETAAGIKTWCSWQREGRRGVGSWQTVANDSAVAALVVLVLGRTVPGRQVPVFWGGRRRQGGPRSSQVGRWCWGWCVDLAVRCGAVRCAGCI